MKFNVYWIYLLPAFFIVSIFLHIPTLLSIIYSFTNFKGGPFFSWIGLANYANIILDPLIQIAMINNIRIMIFNLIVPIPLALFLALVVDGLKFKILKTLMKIVFYLPIAIPLAGAASVYIWVYQPTGPLNTILMLANLHQFVHNWLGDANVAIYPVIFTSVWVQTGYSFLFLYVGLRNVPRTYIEASLIDGANWWRRLYHVVLPLIRPALIIAVFSAIINSLRAFDIVAVMTRGGPYRSTEVLAHYFYRESFYTYNFGYGSAIAIILFSISLVAILPFIMWSTRGEVEVGPR